LRGICVLFPFNFAKTRSDVDLLLIISFFSFFFFKKNDEYVTILDKREGWSDDHLSLVKIAM
jgi:hypothetical protein